MNPLKQSRLKLDNLLYKRKINVALHRVERSRAYVSFRKRFRDVLFSQIEQIAKHNYLDSAILLAKAVNPFPNPLTVQIGVFLGDNLAINEINLSDHLVSMGTVGGQAVVDKMGFDGVFGLTNKAIVDYFGDHARLVLNSVDDYTKEWIASQIQQGKDQGLNPDEIANLLIDEGAGISKVRADRIVLTETAFAMTYTELEAAARYGIQEIVWRTSADDRVDEICEALDGEAIRIGGTFSDGSDGPPAHPNCRCFIEEVIPEDYEVPTQIWLGE